MSSKDYELGKRIQKLLLDNCLENPVIPEYIDKWQDSAYLEQIKDKFAAFLKVLGFDLNDKSICKTPSRVVEFLINESFYGLDYKNFPCIATNVNNYKYTMPLVSSGITINSTCEHHLVAISGYAEVAYIPGGKIVGLSKINRLVDFFARRPQVQERLTRQIFVTLQEVLETDAVAVAIKAAHNCIVIRGVRNVDTENLTLELGGKFLTDEVLKNSFYNAAFNLKLA